MNNEQELWVIDYIVITDVITYEERRFRFPIAASEEDVRKIWLAMLDCSINITTGDYYRPESADDLAVIAGEIVSDEGEEGV